MKIIIIIMLLGITFIQWYFSCLEFKEYRINKGNTVPNRSAQIVLILSIILDMLFCKPLLEISIIGMIVFYMITVIPVSVALCFAFGEEAEDEWSSI